MKKQLLALVAGLSFAATASADLLTQGLALKNDVINNVSPVVGEIVHDIVSGDFDRLESYLQANVGKLNIAPAISFIQSQLPAVSNFIQTALSNENTINTIKSQLPAEWQSQFANVRNTVLNNLGEVHNLGQQLNALRNVNLADKIPTIVSALRSIAASPQYAEFKPQLVAFYNEKLKPFADSVQQINFNKIGDAVTEGLKAAQGESFDLLKVTPGLGEARRALPNIIGLLQNLAVFALAINDQLIASGTTETLPYGIASALRTIQQNSSAVSSALTDFNNTINRALGR